jgi:hypothetical protein
VVEGDQGGGVEGGVNAVGIYADRIGVVDCEGCTSGVKWFPAG